MTHSNSANPSTKHWWYSQVPHCTRCRPRSIYFLHGDIARVFCSNCKWRDSSKLRGLVSYVFWSAIVQFIVEFVLLLFLLSLSSCLYCFFLFLFGPISTMQHNPILYWVLACILSMYHDTLFVPFEANYRTYNTNVFDNRRVGVCLFYPSYRIMHLNAPPSGLCFQF